MSVGFISNPNNMDDVFKELDSSDGVKILAGGTDLMINIKKSKVNYSKLINIMNIQELKSIKEINDHIVIGAANTFSDIKANSEIMKSFGALEDCCNSMGSPQVRNAATIGGNIVNSAPASDSVPVLMALHASLKFQNKQENRIVKCSDYYKYFDENKIRNNEILTGIILNKFPGTSGFYKLGKRNSLSIARLSCAVYIEAKAGKVQHFRVALGAVGRFPFRVVEVEKDMEGKNIYDVLSDDVICKLQMSVFNSINGRKTMPFKKEAIVGVYKNAVSKAFTRGGIHCHE